MSFLYGRFQAIQAISLLLVSLLFTLITLWALEAVWQDRASDIHTRYKTLDSAIMGEFISNLNQLNSATGMSPCSPEMLKLMRIAEYRSRYWHEYAYVEDGLLLCSTSLGVLDQPIPEAPADFVNDEFSFTRNFPVPLLDGTVSAMRMQQGSYRALLKPMANPADSESWLDMGVFTLAQGEYQEVAGSATYVPGREYIPDSFKKPYVMEWYDQGYWVSQRCLRQDACAVVSVDIIEFISSENELVSLAVVGYLVIILLVAMLLPLHYQRFFSLHLQVRRGIRPGRIVCHYQPVISIDQDRPVNCEVLARWIDESGALVYPDQFIPAVEAHGLTSQLTREVLLAATGDLQKAGLLGKIPFSINAFPEDIESGALLALIDEVLLPEFHSLLTVELTEKEINDMDHLCAGIMAMRARGIRVAIDDFGTGYSNLNHLEKLCVDYIKIDKSFVWGLDESTVHSGLVQNIVYLAESLGLQTVAEGVETQQQLKMLAQLDVQYVQGYYFSRPLPFDQFQLFLERYKKRSVTPRKQTSFLIEEPG